MQACNPISLFVVIGIAWLYMSCMYEQRKGGYMEPREAPPIVGQPTLTLASLAQARTPTIKRLSPAKLQERRTCRLCFNCDEKLSPYYHCKKLFLIEEIFPSIDEPTNDIAIEAEKEEEIPKISFYAI